MIKNTPEYKLPMKAKGNIQLSKRGELKKSNTYTTKRRKKRHKEATRRYYHLPHFF